MFNLPINLKGQRAMDFTFVEPEESFTWLHGEAIYPVVLEPRGQRNYWYMRKMIQGQIHRIYLAPAGKLSAELLNNAAAQIAAAASPVQPNEAQS